MDISIRKFQREDIPFKVKWINDEKNNKYLHYDLPLEVDKTNLWFISISGRVDRLDCTITYNEKPIGLIGLIDIDLNSKEAEYYICLGDDEFKGKGIANIATQLLIKQAYTDLNLKKLFLYTEVANLRAQKLFEKSGFVKKKLIENDLFYKGKYVDRYLYVLDLQKHFNSIGDISNGFI